MGHLKTAVLSIPGLDKWQAHKGSQSTTDFWIAIGEWSDCVWLCPYACFFLTTSCWLFAHRACPVAKRMHCPREKFVVCRYSLGLLASNRSWLWVTQRLSECKATTDETSYQFQEENRKYKDACKVLRVNTILWNFYLTPAYVWLDTESLCVCVFIMDHI